MKKTILTILGAVALSCALFTQQALADSISFAGGTASANHDSSVTSPTTVSFAGTWSVFAGSGIFAGTAGASPVTMNAFTFSGDSSTGNAFCTTCPQVQWTFTGSGGHTFTFTLSSLVPGSMATRAGSIGGSGVGSVVVDGGPAVSGTWGITGTGNNYQYGANFTFVTTTTVPDGGSAVALMGVALTGIEGLRRLLRRRNK